MEKKNIGPFISDKQSFIVCNIKIVTKSYKIICIPKTTHYKLRIAPHPILVIAIKMLEKK